MRCVPTRSGHRRRRAGAQRSASVNQLESGTIRFGVFGAHGSTSGPRSCSTCCVAILGCASSSWGATRPTSSTSCAGGGWRPPPPPCPSTTPPWRSTRSSTTSWSTSAHTRTGSPRHRHGRTARASAAGPRLGELGQRPDPRGARHAGRVGRRQPAGSRRGRGPRDDHRPRRRAGRPTRWSHSAVLGPARRAASARLGWAPLRPRQFDRFAIVHRRDAVLSPATQLMVELVTAQMQEVADSASASGAPGHPRTGETRGGLRIRALSPRGGRSEPSGIR